MMSQSMVQNPVEISARFINIITSFMCLQLNTSQNVKYFLYKKMHVHVRLYWTLGRRHAIQHHQV